jgi:uncharacterized protein
MSRLLLIVAIIAVIYWWFKSVRKQQPRQDEPLRTEDMVRCVRCGVHLPKNESFFAGGKYYCSEAHSRDQSGNTD